MVTKKFPQNFSSETTGHQLPGSQKKVACDACSRSSRKADRLSTSPHEMMTLPVLASSVQDGDGVTVQAIATSFAPPDLLLNVKELDQLTTKECCLERKAAILAEIKKFGYELYLIDGRRTLTITYRIRFRGIDAPELKQQYGKEAKDALISLIENKSLLLKVYAKDQHNRLVADVYSDGCLIQESMLRGGHAWHFTRYDRRPSFSMLHKEAKQAGRGLWKDKNAIAPWVWCWLQKKHRKAKGCD